MEPACDTDDFEAMAREALAGLPPAFRGPAEGVLLRVVDWPEPDMLRELQIEDPIELTGLYDGVPMTQRPRVIMLTFYVIENQSAVERDRPLADAVGHSACNRRRYPSP